MTAKRFAMFGFFLCLCFVLAAPAAQAQSLAGFKCIQNLSNSEYKTSSASQLAGACKDQEIWQLTQVSGTSYYCVKNESNGQYLENHARSLADTCDGNSEYWSVSTVNYQGETVYCVKNVDNNEYLTSNAGSLSGSCGQQQYWRIYNPDWQCVKNQGNSEYLE